MKTPEGRAKIDAAMKKAEDVRARFEMAATMFFREHIEMLRYALRRLPVEDGEYTLATGNEDIAPLLDERSKADDDFLHALGGDDITLLHRKSRRDPGAGLRGYTEQVTVNCGQRRPRR